jgi:cytochrome c oxidase assembly protein subunit 15
VISFPLILAAVALRRRVHEGPERQSRWYVVSGGLLAVAGAVLVAGTVVTGTGLHAGDIDISRIPFDPAMVTQLHGDFVFLLVGRAAGRAAATAARARALDPGFRS